MDHYLVAYDIHSDTLRRNMGRLLESSGTRLQRSVFVVQLSDREKKQLEAFVREKLEEDDSLLILPCCASCLNKARLAEQTIPKRTSLFM